MVNANLGSTQGLNTSSQLGSVHLLLTQLIMIGVVTAWTFAFSIAIFYLAILIKGRTTKDEEIQGLDKVLLGEDSYSKGIILNKAEEQNNTNLEEKLIVKKSSKDKVKNIELKSNSNSKTRIKKSASVSK